MKMLIFILVLLPGLVMAGTVNKPKRNSTQKKLDQLVGRLKFLPGKPCISQETASAFEVPQHWECRAENIIEGLTTDGLHHNANVLVETSTAAVEQGARRLVLMTHKFGIDRRSEYFTLILSMDGEIVRALATVGGNDEKLNPVMGSAVDIPQDLASKEVRSRFKHELEFWLDGKYRKKPVKGTKAPAKS